MKRRDFLKALGLSGIGLAFRHPYHARLVFAGDTLLGGYYNGIYGTQTRLLEELEGLERPEEIFGDLLKSFGNADLACINLEGPVTPDFPKSYIESRMIRKSFPLRQTEKTGGILKRAGIGIVTLANNHIYDFDGETGLRYTLELLDLPYLGVGKGEDAYQGLELDLNGIRIYLSGLTDILDPEWMVAERGKLGVAGIPEKSGYGKSRRLQCFRKNLEEARADFKIVFMHWGPPFGPEVNSRQTEISRLLFESGADIVIGCHSHCKQPEYFWRSGGKVRKLLVYGMGNLVFGGKRGRQALSCLAEIDLYKDRDCWIEYRIRDFIPNRDGDFKPVLMA